MRQMPSMLLPFNSLTSTVRDMSHLVSSAVTLDLYCDVYVLGLLMWPFAIPQYYCSNIAIVMKLSQSSPLSYHALQI